MVKALNLIFRITQGVGVIAVCNDNDIGTFLFRLEFRLIWVEYSDLIVILMPIDERNKLSLYALTFRGISLLAEVL